MATYGPQAASGYAWGTSLGWNHPDDSFDLITVSDDPTVAWIGFDGLAAVLAASSISAATLRLTVPDSDSEDVSLQADAAEDAAVPVSEVDSASRSVTTASVTADVGGSGSHVVTINVLSILEELRLAVNGEQIAIRIIQSSALGELTGITGTLEVEYTPGDAVEPVELFPVAAEAIGHATAAQSMLLPAAGSAIGHASAVSGLLQIVDAIAASGHANLLVQSISPYRVTAIGHASGLQSALLPISASAIGHGAPVTAFLPNPATAIGHASTINPALLPSVSRASGHARRIRSGSTFPKISMTAVNVQAAIITAERQ